MFGVWACEGMKPFPAKPEESRRSPSKLVSLNILGVEGFRVCGWVPDG